MIEFQKIIEKIPDSIINQTINEIADLYDLTGKCFGVEKSSTFSLNIGEITLNKWFNLTPEILELVERCAETVTEEDLSNDEELSIFAFLDSDIVKKECVYRSIVNYLVYRAKSLCEIREHHGLNVGNSVDYKKCASHFPFMDNIEFYKDGAWGIATQDGLVLARNHLTEQPSKAYQLVNNNKCHFRKIQDRDTKLYGILSCQPFCEAIHCFYEGLDILDYYIHSIKHFFVKVKRFGKWGLYDDNCALLIDCKYDEIRLIDEYIECIEDVDYKISNETYEDVYVVSGKKYLYNFDGELLIGGYDNLDIWHEYLLFYFGISYDYQPFGKIRFSYKKAKCLTLNKEYKTIIKGEGGRFKFSKGYVFDSIYDLLEIVPHDVLLDYYIDLSDIHDGFIYSHNPIGEQYFVPDFIENGFYTSEEMESYIDGLTNWKKTEPTKNGVISKKERLMDDTIISIIKLNKEGDIEWSHTVNEFGKSNDTFFYRRGNLIGIFDERGLTPALYDAISIDSFDGRTYLCSIKQCNNPQKSDIGNPNFFSFNDKCKHVFLQYFTFIEGNIVRVVDDWKIFDPTKCRWFPCDFSETYRIY